MNINITKSDHNRLEKSEFIEFKFGSRLFGTNTKDSDHDLLRIYKFETVFNQADDSYLPNIHSFKYDDVKNNTQYIWVSERQFYQSVYLGDGTIYSDIILFSNHWNDNYIISVLRTFKVIKSYCGVTKRDLRNNCPKKLKIAHRSIFTAQCLIDNIIPKTEDIQKIDYSKTKDELLEWESSLRKKLISLYDSKKIHNFHIPKSSDPLLQIILDANNFREFKY